MQRRSWRAILLRETYRQLFSTKGSFPSFLTFIVNGQIIVLHKGSVVAITNNSIDNNDNERS